MTSEQLIALQHSQKAIGDRGEDFVLRYERQRLHAHPRLQDICILGRADVGMGYDILSFQGPTSTQYDRYIEVKTYSGEPHFFLSAGEQAAASKYGTNYYLYLVDLSQISTPGYQPLIIQDPIHHLSEEWHEQIQTREYVYTPTVSQELPTDLDTATVLVGCYHSNEHLNWIRHYRVYNVRQGSINGHVLSDDVSQAVRYLLLYNSVIPRTYRLYTIRDVHTATRAEMFQMQYPNPHAPQYLLYEIGEYHSTPPLDILQLLRLHNDKLQRTSGTPIYLSGKEFRRYLLTAPVTQGTTQQRVYSNEGKPWTSVQSAKLRALYLTGTSIAQLAHDLCRSSSEIRTQLQLLGILKE